MAKGVRKSGSRFGARLEPTSHVALQCYRGRELDVVTQVETIDANRALRESYACLTHAVSMLEAVDQVAQEREPAPALYRMLVGALRTLSDAAVTGRDPGVLLEAAEPRRLPPVPRRVRPLRRERAVHRLRPGRGRGALRELRSARGRRVEPEALAFLGQLVGGELHRAMASHRPRSTCTRSSASACSPSSTTPNAASAPPPYSEDPARRCFQGPPAAARQPESSVRLPEIFRDRIGANQRSDYPVRPWPAPT